MKYDPVIEFRKRDGKIVAVVIYSDGREEDYPKDKYITTIPFGWKRLYE